jgi:hypothetical protein
MLKTVAAVLRWTANLFDPQPPPPKPVPYTVWPSTTANGTASTTVSLCRACGVWVFGNEHACVATGRRVP